MTVPADRQCTHGRCERGVVDPTAPVPICEQHLEAIESSEPVSPSRASNSEYLSDGNSREANTQGRVGVNQTGEEGDGPRLENKRGNPEESDHAGFGTTAGVFPESLKAVDQWVCWKCIDGTKKAFAPWSDRDHPAVNQDTDARYSWSLPANWTDFEEAKQWADMVPDIDGVGFVLQKANDPYNGDADPFAFIDYDDVRDPETGEVHSFVRERLEDPDTFAQVSTSGTGAHEILFGELPEGVKTIQTALPDDDRFPDAEIEVYDGKRFVAMTGDHVQGTPIDAVDCEGTLEAFVDQFATVPESKPDVLVQEPTKTREEIVDVDETDDIQDVFDAIAHTKPRDIRLRSTVTAERSDGTKGHGSVLGQQ